MHNYFCCRIRQEGLLYARRTVTWC